MSIITPSVEVGKVWHDSTHINRSMWSSAELKKRQCRHSNCDSTPKLNCVHLSYIYRNTDWRVLCFEINCKCISILQRKIYISLCDSSSKSSYILCMHNFVGGTYAYVQYWTYSNLCLASRSHCFDVGKIVWVFALRRNTLRRNNLQMSINSRAQDIYRWVTGIRTCV